jgi:adenylate cyclase
MSGDAEQEYFSDGLTEDIITELSRFNGLLVAARNSSFSFKGRSPKITDVGRELGVQYVLEGSVRKAGNRVRVTGQLIDAASGNHLWAERYDRDLSDIFALQDELVHTIAGVVPGQIDRASITEISRKPPANLTAYEYELRGRWALSHWSEGLAAARNWYLKSIASDPDYGLAHAGLGMVYSYGLYVLGFSPEEAMQKAKWHASRALSLDPQNATISACAAFTYHVSCEPKAALQQSERAVQLNPNDPFALYVRACALTYGGRPEEALDWYARSEKLKAYDPDDQRYDTLCDCYYLLGQYEKALDIFEHYESLPAFLYLPKAAHYARLGEMEKARAAVEQYYRLRPEGHDPSTMAEYQCRMCLRESDSEHWRGGYRLIGLSL